MSQMLGPNRLVNEKSPYLLQHAYNPVDWYPWCEEAFNVAATENKPIFLSIGYSTCHWCHVMERESFEDIHVADYLNEHFVSIKVDREERPDIDSIYISACEAITGSGGWPLSIFIDANKNPFFAGTYFPKNDSRKMAGFLSILHNIVDIWNTKYDALINQAKEISNAIKVPENELKSIDESIPDTAYQQLLQSFESDYGGFSKAPKFPSPHNILFLLKYSQVKGDSKALSIATKTLNSMMEGGIFDHVGYGFSRYSTDSKWLVPHFEKMLYDNALLCMAYAECYLITRNKKYSLVVEKIIEYLTRDLYSIDGAFFTAEDADSEGVEGKFYVFSKSEVDSILEEDSEEFSKYYNITESGNFEGKNILNLINSSVPEEKIEFINKCRKKIFEYRNKRVRPSRDEKILTSFNGLTIAALAIAGRALNNEVYIDYAIKATEFILKNLKKDNKLIARYCDGEAKYLGYAEDYAYFILGLIELYEVTFNDLYLNEAISLNETFINCFYDNDYFGFYLNDKDSEKLIMRLKDIYDSATPSYNSVEVYNLFRLSKLTHNNDLECIAVKTLESFMENIESIPMGHSFSALNILYYSHGSIDAVLVGDKIEDLKDFIDVLYKHYIPFINIRALTSDQQNEYKMVNSLPTAYICKNFSCNPPITSPEELEKLIY